MRLGYQIIIDNIYAIHSILAVIYYIYRITIEFLRDDDPQKYIYTTHLSHIVVTIKTVDQKEYCNTKESSIEPKKQQYLHRCTKATSEMD